MPGEQERTVFGKFLGCFLGQQDDVCYTRQEKEREESRRCGAGRIFPSVDCDGLALGHHDCPFR